MSPKCSVKNIISIGEKIEKQKKNTLATINFTALFIRNWRYAFHQIPCLSCKTRNSFMASFMETLLTHFMKQLSHDVNEVLSHPLSREFIYPINKSKQCITPI